jgi:hypothetical protein
MLPMFGALQRTIARGVAVHAAGMRQQFADLGKDRTRTRSLICDGIKLGWRLKILMGSWVRIRLRKTYGGGERCETNY